MRARWLLCLGLALWLLPGGDGRVRGEEVDQVDEFLSGSGAEGQPWHLTGGRLTGAVDGPIQIDSLIVHHGQLEIGARRGLWRPDEELVELQGDVAIRDSARVLNAVRGFYYRERMFLEMETDVRGTGPEGRLQSDRLTYDRRNRVLALSGRVQLDEEEHRSLRSEWLRYDLADSFITAGGKVWLRDGRDSVDVFGDLLFYDRGAGLATIVASQGTRPRLVQGGHPEEPRFVVEADTLRFHTAARIGEAVGAVSFTRGALQGTCDQALFLMASDRLLLTGEPSVLDSEGVISGDSMAVELRDGRADRMTVWGHTRAEYFPPGRPGEAHFAVGDTLSAYLEEGLIRSVLVERNAQSLYIPAAPDRQRGVGLNWTRGNRIRLLLREGRVSRVQFEGDVSGRYVLPDRISAGDTLSTAAFGTLTESAAGRDSLVATSSPAQRPPPIPGVSAIRRQAESGDLAPPDSLIALLPFDVRETVLYAGDGIEFAVASERITISGNAQVTYQGMELASEQIIFDSPRNLVLASGAPSLRDGESEVRGEQMTYRIDTRMGLVFQGRSEFEGGHYRGGRVKRVAEKTFFVRDVDFTSCDEEEPHFHFHSSHMKVITKDRVVARPVVLYLGHIPLLALPYAAFPIRSGRQSGLLIPDVEFGFDTDRGRFLRNVGYYFAPNDYVDALMWMDYYERDPRVAVSGRFRYKVRYLLNGRVESSFSRDESYGGGKSDRWLLKVDHDQVLGERFTFKVAGNFQSDKDYAADRDFGASVDERINRVLRSQMSLHKSWSAASLSLAADRTEYLDEESGGSTRISQSAPSVNLSLSSFPIGVRPDERGYGGRLPFLATTYLRADARLRSVYSKNWEDEVTTNHAAGVNLSLSDKRRLLGMLNLTPSASLAAAWADEDREGEKNPVGLSWRTGLSASTTLYGTFFPRLGPWEGLRHVIELSASYGYSPQIPYLKDFPSVGGISLSSSKSSRVSLRMSQRFHVKLRRGEEVSKHENLLTWTSSTSYDFLAKERARESGGEAHPWGDLSHGLRLQPGRYMYSEFSLVHDLEEWRRQSLSLRTTLRLEGGRGGDAGGEGSGSIAAHGDFGDPEVGAGSGPDREPTVASLTGPWKLSATHVFSMGRDWDSHRSSLNLSAGLTLSPGWRAQYSVYYDLKDQEVTSQGYSLYRDLHCWHAVLERRTSGGRSSYYFRISVKDLPDLKYERRRVE